MGYTHIDENERRRIESAVDAGKGVRVIARLTGRSPSTISEELTRNSVRKKYSRQRAELKARLRRKNSKLQCLKVAMDPVLKSFITREIAHDQSPEAISGRLKKIETQMQYA